MRDWLMIMAYQPSQIIIIYNVAEINNRPPRRVGPPWPLLGLRLPPKRCPPPQRRGHSQVSPLYSYDSIKAGTRAKNTHPQGITMQDQPRSPRGNREGLLAKERKRRGCAKQEKGKGSQTCEQGYKKECKPQEGPQTNIHLIQPLYIHPLLQYLHYQFLNNQYGVVHQLKVVLTQQRAQQKREKEKAEKQEKAQKKQQQAQRKKWQDSQTEKKMSSQRQKQQKREKQLARKRELKQIAQREQQQLAKISRKKQTFAEKKLTQAQIAKNIEQRQNKIAKQESNNSHDRVFYQENPNRNLEEYEVASNVEEALRVLDVGEEKHPQKRYKAAYEAYCAKREIQLRVQYPKLKRTQRLQMMHKEFQKSPDNPFNKNTVAYNDKSRKEAKKAKEEEKKREQEEQQKEKVQVKREDED